METTGEVQLTLRPQWVTSMKLCHMPFTSPTRSVSSEGYHQIFWALSSSWLLQFLKNLHLVNQPYKSNKNISYKVTVKRFCSSFCYFSFNRPKYFLYKTNQAQIVRYVNINSKLNYVKNSKTKLCVFLRVWNLVLRVKARTRFEGVWE